jgi:hypothetical protein
LSFAANLRTCPDYRTADQRGAMEAVSTTKRKVARRTTRESAAEFFEHAA